MQCMGSDGGLTESSKSNAGLRKAMSCYSVMSK